MDGYCEGTGSVGSETVFFSERSASAIMFLVTRAVLLALLLRTACNCAATAGLSAASRRRAGTSVEVTFLSLMKLKRGCWGGQGVLQQSASG
jgi:hypothetical protein